MGQYSKILSEKTEDELKEIINSITTYTGEFIDDYLAELDTRRMLWDMKFLLSGKDLITLTIKLESISNPKYLNLLKRELEIRGLEENYEQQKMGFVIVDSKTEGKKSNNWVYGGIIAFMLFASFLYKKLNKPTKQDFENKINVPSINNPTIDYNQKLPADNSTGTSYELRPSKIDFDLAEITTKKKLEIKLPKINNKMSDFAKPPKFDEILRNYEIHNNLNEGFHKILDTMSK